MLAVVDPCSQDETCVEPTFGDSNYSSYPRRLISLISSYYIMLGAILWGQEAAVNDVAQEARQLLARKCFSCHGPDRNSKQAQKTDLRLDLRESAVDDIGSIKPGNADGSELMARVIATDGDRMPPLGHGKALSNRQIDLLRKWINDGATFVDKHWAFLPLKTIEIPSAEEAAGANPIDAFILDRLTSQGIAPSPRADRRTLIRRVFANAIGMPPSPEEFSRFMEDGSDDAYQGLIDRVLANRHFGERWARHWLDVARFAESGGFELDGDRPNAFHYRDFVIRAFNEDLPYDKFIRWQIAGDEIAPEKPEALKATGFLGCGVRNAVVTKNQVEKERYDELDDILATSSVAMLGLSVGCARCHDHKYDPITANEYYSLLSTFTTTIRSEMTVQLPSEKVDRELEDFHRDHEKLVTELRNYEKSVSHVNFQQIDHAPLRLGDWQSSAPFETTSYQAGHDTVFPPEDSPDSTAVSSVAWTARPELGDGKSHTLKDSNRVFYFHRTIEAASPTPTVFTLGADDTIKVWLDGKLIGQRIVAGAVAPDQIVAHVMLAAGKHNLLVKIVNGPGIGGMFFKIKQQGLPEPMLKIASIPLSERTPEQDAELIQWSRQFDPKWLELAAGVNAHLQRKPQYPTGTILVSTEGRPGFRPAVYGVQGPEFYEQTYALERGNPNTKIAPATQGFLGVLMNHPEQEAHWIEQAPDGSPTSYRRKSLANWMTDSEAGAGDLLARVIVNRIWQHHFGRGLVETVNDFGTQGALPSHPPLLDWLAGELIRSGWRLKHIHRLIMTSETYQQASTSTPPERSAEVDPENRLLWRYPPRRLDAEAIRDSMLSVSGQLDATMFGKGTLLPGHKRRSIYFTVKRSKLIPMLTLFDAPEALSSKGKRVATTTAPQALMLINNPQVRELAEAFAQRILTEAGDSSPALVTRAYQNALNRDPSANERRAAIEFFEAQKIEYQESGQPNALKPAVTDLTLAVFALNEFVYIH